MRCLILVIIYIHSHTLIVRLHRAVLGQRSVLTSLTFITLYMRQHIYNHAVIISSSCYALLCVKFSLFVSRGNENCSLSI